MFYESTFTPLPYYDESSGKWKPSVRQSTNGYFTAWLVFDIAFDNPTDTTPLANQFASELAEQFKRGTEATLRMLTERWA